MNFIFFFLKNSCASNLFEINLKSGCSSTFDQKNDVELAQTLNISSSDSLLDNHENVVSNVFNEVDNANICLNLNNSTKIDCNTESRNLTNPFKRQINGFNNDVPPLTCEKGISYGQNQMLGPLNNILGNIFGERDLIDDQKFRKLKSDFDQQDNLFKSILHNEVTHFVDITNLVLRSISKILGVEYSYVICNSYRCFLDLIVFKLTQNQNIIDSLMKEVKAFSINDVIKSVDVLSNSVMDIIVKFIHEKGTRAQILSEISKKVNEHEIDCDVRGLLLMLLVEYSKLADKPFSILSVVAFISLDSLSSSCSIYPIEELKKKSVLIKTICILQAYDRLREKHNTNILENLISRLIDRVIFNSFFIRLCTSHDRNVLKLREKIIFRNKDTQFKNLVTPQNSNFILYVFGLKSQFLQSFIKHPRLLNIEIFNDRYNVAFALISQAFCTFNSIVISLSSNIRLATFN